MVSLVIASFVAGFLTVLAPCLLPLLPVVIGGSVIGGSGRRKRPFIIIGSLLVSIIIFTLIVQAVSSFIYVSDLFWHTFSASLIFFVGITFLFPSMWSRILLVSKISILFNRILGKGIEKSGVAGDVIIGISLGPIFSSCSPTYLLILATILPASFFEGIVYLIFFVTGLGSVLLLIVLLGQSAVEKFGILADTDGLFKKIMGIIMIVIAIIVFFGIDKDISVFLLDIGFLDFTQFELDI